METLQINTGEVRLAVNGDESRVIVFNPTDLLFAEKFERLFQDFEAKFDEFQRRAAEIDEQTKADSSLDSFAASLELARDVCEFTNERIDNLFGAGTSQKAFNGAMDLGDPETDRPSMYQQFFAGILKYFQKARAGKLKGYLPPEATLPKSRKRK